MKKIVLTMMALMTMTFTFASSKSKAPEVTAVNMNQNYDMRVDYDRLANTLQLNYDQIEAVETIHNQFIRDMHKAAQADEADRKDMVKKAADKEMKYMRYVLNNKQYNTFGTLLNLTLNNRGLLK